MQGRRWTMSTCRQSMCKRLPTKLSPSGLQDKRICTGNPQVFSFSKVVKGSQPAKKTLLQISWLRQWLWHCIGSRALNNRNTFVRLTCRLGHKVSKLKCMSVEKQILSVPDATSECKVMFDGSDTAGVPTELFFLFFVAMGIGCYGAPTVRNRELFTLTVTNIYYSNTLTYLYTY